MTPAQLPTGARAMTSRRLVHPTLALVALLILGACGAAGTTSAEGPIRVVASTNVYGDIVGVIGGSHVKVTSILTNPDQDPHSFEVNPRTALSVAKADLLIENGGGYDDYMGKLRTSAQSKAPVIDVVRLSGKKAPAGGELNEHVWYDFPTVDKFADAVAERLGKLDPDHADDFTARATSFKKKVDALIAREDALKATDTGKAIGITEPVPLYLTAAAGLTNKTPAEFSEAIEEGDDVSAPVLQQTLDLYRDKQVVALVYNEQTSGPITEQVKAAAEAAGVAVVPVTETLPDGKDYLSWMSGNLDALAAAVGR